MAELAELENPVRATHEAGKGCEASEAVYEGERGVEVGNIDKHIKLFYV